MEVQEIVERIDNVTNSISSAFENGSIDIDKIIDELESLKTTLTVIGERLSDTNTIRNPLKSRMQGKANHQEIIIENYQ